jgi:hypothetical protein
MAWSYNLTCDRCSFIQRDFGPTVFLQAYLLPDGGVTPLPFQVGWCHKCCEVVRAEWPAKALMQWADAWDQRGQLSEREEFRLRRRMECERLRAVAASRRSPPRCLVCGSVGVIEFGEWDEPMPHPGCGGRLARSLSVHRDFGHPLPLWAYSPEGEAIGIQVARHAELSAE